MTYGLYQQDNRVLCTDETLTAAYVVVNDVKMNDTAKFNQMTLMVDHTLNVGENSTILLIKVELSPDNVNWFQTTTSSIVGGVDTLSLHEYRRTNGTAYGRNETFAVDVPVTARGVRVSVREMNVTGSLFGTVSITAILSDEK